MLKHADPKVAKVFKDIGPFKIKPRDVPRDIVNNMGSIEFRKGIMKIGQSGYYWGEWIVDTDLRHGRGIMVEYWHILEKQLVPLSSNLKSSSIEIKITDIDSENDNKDIWIYEGFWNKNKMEGQGRLITPEYVYCGEWTNNSATGKGILFEL